MRNLKFKYLRAENFICFESLEINFEKLGNIVSIQGRNLDVSDSENLNANNGVGKTTIIDAISYGIYGKTIKKPKKLSHGDVVNNKNNKKLIVEFLWDDYRILRTRKADGKTGELRFWKSDKAEWTKENELTLGGAPATQEDIEKTIGLTYEAFANIAVFSDENNGCFLECDPASKRQIVENLLSLEKYNNYFQAAKDIVKEIKEEVKNLTKEYESLDVEQSKCELRIKEIEKQEKEWYAARKKEEENLLIEIKSKTDELENSKTGTALLFYQQAQEQLEDLKTKIAPIEEEKTRANEILSASITQVEVLNNDIAEVTKEVIAAKKEYEGCEKVINENKKAIEESNTKTGQNCPYCLRTIEQDNFASILEKAEAVIKEQEPKFIEYKKMYIDTSEKYRNLAAAKKKIDDGIVGVRTQLNGLNSKLSEIHCSIAELSKVQKPDSSLNEVKLIEQIEGLKKQVLDKQSQINGPTPFETIKTTALTDLKIKIEECAKKKIEIKDKDREQPYYEFWVKAFGDSGIRKYIIDGIIPTLNSGIEYWMQFLIDNKIKLVFNNELEEAIDRYPFNGRRYVYHGMSGGQRRRLNLAISQAFAHIMMLNSGASPSLVFLDEVSINIDEAGVEGIYRMICELSKDKQVFVIDHNPNLLNMLSGCDQIYLEMKDEVSKRIDNSKHLN